MLSDPKTLLQFPRKSFVSPCKSFHRCWVKFSSSHYEFTEISPHAKELTWFSTNVETQQNDDSNIMRNVRKLLSSSLFFPSRTTWIENEKWKKKWLINLSVGYLILFSSSRFLMLFFFLLHFRRRWIFELSRELLASVENIHFARIMDDWRGWSLREQRFVSHSLCYVFYHPSNNAKL